MTEPVRNQLPPFPVDDGTLDMLWTAIFPGPEAERSSVSDLLDWYSELGGSDIRAVAAETESESGTVFREMRDQHYHVNNVLAALIEEIRRLRTTASEVP